MNGPLTDLDTNQARNVSLTWQPAQLQLLGRDNSSTPMGRNILAEI